LRLCCRQLSEIEAVHGRHTASGVTASDIAGNPLEAFHLIRRFSTTWREMLASTANVMAFSGKNRFETSREPLKLATVVEIRQRPLVSLFPTRWPKNVSHYQIIKKSYKIVLKPVNEIRFTRQIEV